MKRLFVLGFAVMAFGASVFASGKGTIIENLDSKVTQEAISRYLSATVTQEHDLRFLFGISQKSYKKEIAKGATDEEAFNKVIGSTLMKMRDSLTRDQYRKFVMVLNQTVRNNEAANALYVVEK